MTTDQQSMHSPQPVVPMTLAEVRVILSASKATAFSDDAPPVTPDIGRVFATLEAWASIVEHLKEGVALMTALEAENHKLRAFVEEASDALGNAIAGMAADSKPASEYLRLVGSKQPESPNDARGDDDDS